MKILRNVDFGPYKMKYHLRLNHTYVQFDLYPILYCSVSSCVAVNTATQLLVSKQG